MNSSFINASYPQGRWSTRPASGSMSATVPTAREVIARVRNSASITQERGLFKVEFRAMSTACRVQLHGVSATLAEAFLCDAVTWTAHFEAKYSRFLADSLISRINAAAGLHWVAIDADTERLFDLCQNFFFFTRGSFDPTALPLMALWNWKQRPAVLPTPAAIDAARELVGWNKVQRQSGAIFLPLPGMALDLGGLGKEYAVDSVVNMAADRGIPNVLVDFGQDVRARGHAPGRNYWWIGLDDPLQSGQCWAGVAVTDHGVATSGDYLRHFVFNGRRYGHIIDPRTGYPALNDCLAVSVLAPSCTMAGLLATSACILGAKEGMQLIESHPEAAAAVTTPNHKLQSRRFHEFIPAS